MQRLHLIYIRHNDIRSLEGLIFILGYVILNFTVHKRYADSNNVFTHCSVRDDFEIFLYIHFVHLLILTLMMMMMMRNETKWFLLN